MKHNIVIKNFLYILFILCLFNPLYRRILGELNLNYILYIFYGALVLFGLLGILKTGFKPVILVVSVFIFCIWYYFSNIYTISSHTFEKSMVLLTTPFYVLGAVKSYKLDFNMKILIRIWFFILLIYTIYASILLYLVGFNFSLFYLKPDIVDYLTYSTLALPFCFYSLSISENKLYKFISYYFLIFSLMSGARVPVLAFALVFAFWLFKKKKFNYIFITGFSVVLILYFFSDMLSIYFDYFLIRFESIGGQDTSINERFLYISKSIDSFLSYPFFGRGINSSGIILSGADDGGYPHNFILEILLELGFIGLIPISIFFIHIIKTGLKSVHTEKTLFLLFIIFFLVFNFMKSFSITEIRFLLFFCTLYYISCKDELRKDIKDI